MNVSGKIIENRIHSLKTHLAEENPVLLEVMEDYRKLDKVAYQMKLLNRGESFATQVPWWPMISILGTFSSGKSTFINHYLGVKLQRSGNQAVDDKFTVLCYTGDDTIRTLPGSALDADPRFPFYRFGEELEKVSPGEGDRIDAYLQLKPCRSAHLIGKTLIDSPGFDADKQRTATLRITHHIVDLSDLVLVFFDARHPEPGAMHDTLKHLVEDTINRHDSEKFLYILNQIDTTAREDNPEEVVAAWQRALAEKGLTAGRFFTIYSPDVATAFEKESQRIRFETKRDIDLQAIHERMHQIEIERAYRIVRRLDKLARGIEEHAVPTLQKQLGLWKNRVLLGDSIAFTALLLGLLAVSIGLDYWDGIRFQPPWENKGFGLTLVGVFSLLLFTAIHFSMRKVMAHSLFRALRKEKTKRNTLDSHLTQALRRNVAPFSSIFRQDPIGWGWLARRRVNEVLSHIDRYVQTLNNQFADPSGGRDTPPQKNVSPDKQPEEAGQQSASVE